MNVQIQHNIIILRMELRKLYQIVMNHIHIKIKINSQYNVFQIVQHYNQIIFMFKIILVYHNVQENTHIP